MKSKKLNIEVTFEQMSDAEGEFSIDAHKNNAKIKVNTHRQIDDLIDTIYHEITHLVLRKYYNLTITEEELLAHIVSRKATETILAMVEELKEM